MIKVVKLTREQENLVGWIELRKSWMHGKCEGWPQLRNSSYWQRLRTVKVIRTGLKTRTWSCESLDTENAGSSKNNVCIIWLIGRTDICHLCFFFPFIAMFLTTSDTFIECCPTCLGFIRLLVRGVLRSPFALKPRAYNINSINFFQNF